MKTGKSWLLMLMVGLLLFPAILSAQEPTDRPFPATVAPESATTGETTGQTNDAETTPEMEIADIQATASAAQVQVAQLESEREALQAELEAAQADNGATTFALVIIVVGVLLAVAVFFGLRRGSD